MSRKRTYSDEEKAAALACYDACAGNMAEAARRSGVPRVTLLEWVRGRVSDGVSDIRQQKRESLADVCERLAHKLAGVADKKAEDLSGKDAMVAAGIAIDKMQLLRGQPTAITAHLHDLTGLSDADIEQLGRILSFDPGGELPVGTRPPLPGRLPA
jgi:transposase-like protein